MIQAVDGKKVTNPRELAVDVAAIKPGDEAHLTVLHDGQSQGRCAEGGAVAERADRPATVEAVASTRSNSGWRWRRCRRISRGQLDVPDGTRGAVVRGVQPGSPAEQAGLQPGDVIVGVGTHPVTSPSDAAREIHSAMDGQDHAVALRVIRNGEAVFVGIQMGQNQAG